MNDLRDATISNNFMFRLVMEKKELCRQLLERILEIKILDISYPEGEKSLEAQLTSKGIRLDIYVTLADGTVVDVEMQTTDGFKSTLGKRARYYQSVLDNDALKKGELYSRLRKTFVIFICTFDPFDKKLSRYTFSNRCHEDSGLFLNDDVYKIFINTRGDRHRISKELANLLDYINGAEPSDEFTRQLQEEVKLQRDDDGRRTLYMTYNQTLMEMEEKGIEKGIERGIEKGRIAALKEMLAAGLTTFEVIKNSGLYTEKELAAIMAP